MTEPQHAAGPRLGDTPPGPPRWVTVAAIVVGLLLLVAVILQLTGLAGEHGPGMHSSLARSPAAVGEPFPADQ